MKKEEVLLMRSILFVPAHSTKLLESASKQEADVLLLDLEDSVQPVENKAVGRKNIKEWVASGKLKFNMIFIRVNDRESGELLRDIHELTIPGVTGFMYPKSKKGEDVYFIDKLLETVEYEKGLPIGSFKLIPLIETTAAVLNAQEICTASSRVISIAYGSEDFTSDLGGIHDPEHTSLFTPRAMIAMAARANGVIPIDTVHINIHDLEDLERNLKLGKILGFEGMMVLHPKELPLVHQYYSPTSEEVEMAELVVRESEIAEKDNKGVVIVNGKFIGPPILRAAKKTLAKKALIDKMKK